VPTNESLEYKESLFTGVKLAACAELLTLISDLEDGDESFVRSRFMNLWQQYDSVVALLIAAGLLKREGKEIRATHPQSFLDLGAKILSGLTKTRNSFAEEVREFLSYFRRDNSGLTYSPHDLLRSSQSAVRNFLLEAGVLETVKAGDCYRIVPGLRETIYEIMRPRKSTSAERLTGLIEERSAIGHTAEQAVLNYERKRLGDKHLADIVHIAEADSEAGYDIRSLRCRAEPVPVFLEVKAVSEDDCSFYWSRNEVAAATWLGEAYCLVLVPIAAFGDCRIEKAQRIWNPAACISQLLMEPMVWRCRAREEGPNKEETNA